MELFIAVLVALVILEAVVIFWLRITNQRLVAQNAVHLFKDHLRSEREADSNYVKEQIPESGEENQQQAEQVQKVQILCRLAEVHLDDLSDEYESNNLKERIEKAIEMAKEITDPFYLGTALYPIIRLAYQAGWGEKKNELLEMVSDPFIKEKIIKNLSAEKNITTTLSQPPM